MGYPGNRDLNDMLQNLTRFYFVLDQEEYDNPIPCDDGKDLKAFEDVDRDKADEYEAKLQESNVDYIRVDL